MPMRLRQTSILAALLLSGCVSMPSGPSMLVLPGTGKNFDQFRADETACRQYAQAQVGGASGNQVAVDSGVRSAALGTVLGAVAGAAIDGSHGAAVGAGTGLLVGSASGTQAGNVSAYGVQQRYDHSYLQCMYAQGHRVPVSGRFMTDSRGPAYGNYAVPPPNTPPPASIKPR